MPLRYHQRPLSCFTLPHSSQSQGSQHYDLRQRPHNFALNSRTGHLNDKKNYIQRMIAVLELILAV